MHAYYILPAQYWTYTACMRKAQGTFRGYLEQCQDEGEIFLHLIEPDAEVINVRKQRVIWFLRCGTIVPHINRQM